MILAPRVGLSTMDCRALRAATSVSSSALKFHDHRRPPRRRHSVDSGLDIIQQHNRLVLCVGGADIRDGHRLLPIAADIRCGRSTSANDVVARRVVNAQVFVEVEVETRETSRSGR